MLDVARGAELVDTVEEGIVIGGLGSAITDVMVEKLGPAMPPVVRLGLPDAFPHKYGVQEDLFEVSGLDAPQIATTASVAMSVKAKEKVA